jgi:4-diphosphocytidyl-2-C-methyl-D-erythritol kinase
MRSKYKNPEEFQKSRARVRGVRTPIASLSASAYFGAMLTLRAYAKINLGLRVLQRRDDGYHDLETVFHRIDLFDELFFEPSESLSLRCIPAGLPTDEQNLCYRAAILLRESLRRVDGARMTLRKNIPSGGGLGGGSSDAAATLLGLIRLWRAEIPAERLRSIALELGSDVPYFLGKGSAYATGRGEILDYFHLEVPYWIVVVYPNIAISTAWAYQHLQPVPRSPAGPGGKSQRPLGEIVRKEMHDLPRLRDLLQNDFEPLVLAEYERVDRVKRTLSDSGAGFVRLSGSGSAVYGFFPDEERARAAAGRLGSDSFVSITSAQFEPDLQPFEK